jgi:hypothetical protein
MQSVNPFLRQEGVSVWTLTEDTISENIDKLNYSNAVDCGHPVNTRKLVQKETW